MKLGISNIAWDPSLDSEVASVLRAVGVDTIDIAPSKYFDLKGSTGPGELLQLRRDWESRGIRIWGMQSLMFGSALNLFGDSAEKEQMLEWLERVFLIGQTLGAQKLVFGSPKNRNCADSGPRVCEQRALPFFARLGDAAEKYGITLCIEPNPREYGSNFLINSHEAANFVAELGHPAVQVQVDFGSIMMSEEDPEFLFESHRGLIGHVHLSTPHLDPIHKHENAVTRYFQALKDFEPVTEMVPTIEMLTTAPDRAVAEIEQSLMSTLTMMRTDSNKGVYP